MTQKFKCPECEAEMGLKEDAHVCPECETSLTLDEAADLFKDGKLIAIVEEKKDDEDVDDEEDDEEDDEDDEKEKKMKKEDIDYKVNVTEHVEALVSGEDLSEEFQKKAATIFESAVNAKIGEIAEQMEANNKIELEEAKTEIEEELSEKVNDYLGYVVEQWMEENKIAVEAGLRTEVTEDFINGLRNLFAESYIDIPEERYDVVEGLAEKVEELESKLDEETTTNIALKKEINEGKAKSIRSEVAEGMAETEKEKLFTLAESVTFESEEQYKEKIETLKESYFNKPSSKVVDKSLNEDFEQEENNNNDDEDAFINNVLAALRSSNN